jgi:hypothetical protein
MTRAHVACLLVLAACEGEIRLDVPDAGTGKDAAHPACSTTCPIRTLVCVDGTCLECNSDRDCKTSELPRCDLAAHRCVRCGSSSDCDEATEICEPQTKQCLKKCTADAQCTEKEARTCDPIRMYCVGCATNAQCTGDHPACDTRTGQCVSCLNDSDCARDTERKRCDPATQRCVRCLDDRDCPSAGAPYCDLSRKVCSGPS